MKLSELNHDQRCHLAWRLDHNTGCGYGTACSVARGERGDLELVEIFQTFGDRTKRSATMLARKVEAFVVDERKRDITDACLELYPQMLRMISDRCKDMDIAATADVMDQIIQCLKNTASLYRVIVPAKAS